MIASGPLDECDCAKAAAKSLPSSTIYVSFLGTTPGDRANLEAAFTFALNSTTFRRKPIYLVPVIGKSQTLYRIDYEELEWSLESVKRLLANEPYFYSLDPSVPIVRADWFVREATFGATYYDLLQMGKTASTLEKRVGLDRKTAENLRARHGARVIDSGVAFHARGIERLGSTLGSYWITHDGATAVKTNPFEKIDELIFKQADAHEIFGQLPNGLFWFALSNAKGELQNAAPISIAADRRDYRASKELKDIVKERPSFKTLEIQNAHSCYGCHALGLRDAPDFVAGIAAEDKLKVRFKDRKIQGQVEDFFDARSQSEAMAFESKAYQRSVERITGMPALQSANTFACVRWKIAEAPVTKADAAAELNVDAQEFEKACQAPDELRLGIAYWLIGQSDTRNAQAVLGLPDDGYKAFLEGQAVPLGSSTLRAFAKGPSISRDLWESVAYREASLLICYQKKPRSASVDEVRRRAKALPLKTGEAAPHKIGAVDQSILRSTDARTGAPIEFNKETGQWQFSKGG